jgi:hypothetical protein
MPKKSSAIIVQRIAGANANGSVIWSTDNCGLCDIAVIGKVHFSDRITHFARQMFSFLEFSVRFFVAGIHPEHSTQNGRDHSPLE